VTINLTGGLFGAVGGSSKVRQYWDNYLQDTDVLIFVVDSTQTLTTAAIELKRLLGDERLNHAPVLVFANMQVLQINCI
jgi:signal recognition particle receptor subunit beta